MRRQIFGMLSVSSHGRKSHDVWKTTDMTQFKIILGSSAFLVGGLTASLVIQDRAEGKLRESDAVLRQQDYQLAVLAAEHQRLSNLVAQANSSSAEDQLAELAKLRSQAEAFRKQTNELGKQLAENRRSRPWRAASRPAWDCTPAIPGVSVASDSNSEEYKKQLGMTSGKIADVRTLSSAVREYAREHHGEFPTNFDQAAPYLYEIQAQKNKLHEQFRKLAESSPPPKEVNLRDLSADKGESGAPAPPKQQESSRLGEFEMVYQGSYNELTNVPWQEVALIRERQAWPTPRGKWARIYVSASGEIEIVESDDNFQSWEAEHIIPPPAAGQQ